VLRPSTPPRRFLTRCEPVLTCPVAAPADSAALTAALARHGALELAASTLAQEADKAADAAARAADAAARAAAAVNTLKLAGIARRDDKRPGGPRLYEKQRNLLTRINRRKAAIARNPLNIEEHHYRKHCDGKRMARRMCHPWHFWQRSRMGTIRPSGGQEAGSRTKIHGSRTLGAI